MEKIRGIIYACLSAATFGMIPLFANTAMQEGVNNDTILVYRYMRPSYTAYTFCFGKPT